MRESEALFKAVFDGASDAVLLLSENRLLDCNPRALEMFGYTKEELLLLHPSDFSPATQPDGKDSRQAALECINLAIQNGAHRFDWLHRRRDNSVFPAEVIQLVRLMLADRVERA